MMEKDVIFNRDFIIFSDNQIFFDIYVYVIKFKVFMKNFKNEM